ncbi:MAG: flavin reductase family protein [Sphaerochaetaceae bacterium]|nr:flavin reductase family protein [Sphaerochaetaceae bacterium]
MRKDLGSIPAVFPMPVLMVAAYDENGKVNVMNAAWGTMCDMDMIALFISEGHKTSKNIHTSKAFTVSLADKAHMAVADYFGMVSGNRVLDKFEKTGFHAVKSAFVNAPVITEFPVTMECELAQVIKTENFHAVIGKIVNVSADESVLSKNGKVEPLKLKALIFDQFQNGYYVAAGKVGQAYNEGKNI